MNLRVSNVQRSLDFYGKYFSILPGKKMATYQPILCADGTFLSVQDKKDGEIEAARALPGTGWERRGETKAGTLDHLSFGLDDFDGPKLAQVLKAGGYAVESTGNGATVLTADPDGILLQIQDAKMVFGHDR